MRDHANGDATAAAETASSLEPAPSTSMLAASSSAQEVAVVSASGSALVASEDPAPSTSMMEASSSAQEVTVVVDDDGDDEQEGGLRQWLTFYCMRGGCRPPVNCDLSYCRQLVNMSTLVQHVCMVLSERLYSNLLLL